MKALRLILPQAAVLTLPVTLLAQTNFPVTPTTPHSFKFRPVGQTMDTGATVAPAPVPAVKQTTYLTLGPARQWKSADGNSRVGQLIAWEQTVTTVKVPANTTPATAVANTAPPALPGKPTLVRDGKIRLLIEHKPYEVPLDRLGADEQKYIQDFQTSLAGKS